MKWCYGQRVEIKAEVIRKSGPSFLSNKKLGLVRPSTRSPHRRELRFPFAQPTITKTAPQFPLARCGSLGFIKFSDTQSGLPTQFIATNVSPTESRTTYLTFAQTKMFRAAGEEDVGTPTPALQSPNERRPLFQYLLAVLVIMLLAESVLAWQLGRRKKSRLTSDSLAA